MLPINFYLICYSWFNEVFMARGQTIKLYIMSDDYHNLKTFELSNWTGKAYIGERKHTKLIQKIDELSVPGVYFLITQENNTLQKNIYIGEADEVNKRIQNHYLTKTNKI